jgi:hypothetical protein
MRYLHAPIVGSFSFRHADGVRKPILTLGLLIQPAVQKENTLRSISVSCSWLILLENILGGSDRPATSAEKKTGASIQSPG